MFSIKAYARECEVRDAYLACLRTRLNKHQWRRLRLFRYTSCWRRIVEVMDSVGATAEQWMNAQFHELPRDVCMRLFRLAAPPPNALYTAHAMDRFICFVGRNGTLVPLSRRQLDDRAYVMSDDFVRMLAKVNYVVDCQSLDDEWLDVVLVHVNSGDISMLWILAQPRCWQEAFFERNVTALNLSAREMLDKRLAAIHLLKMRAPEGVV